MIISLKVPTIGESINEVTLSRWLVKDGDIVALDQSLCEFESDKATLEFPSEKSGKIKIIAQEGADLKIGDEIATLDTDFAVAAAVKTEAPVKEESPVAPQEVKKELHVTPLAEKIAEENKVDVSKVPGTGTGGRITKDDVLRFIKEGASPKEIIAARKQNSRNQTQEKVSKLRKTIAKRLVAVKNETAMLTTFNEVDMSAVMAVREKYKAAFEKKYGVGLGFMSFFVRACCNALQEFPAVNAYFNEEQVTFNDFCDISIAVSTPKGLVVPVLRNAESMSMAEVELKIKELATKGREGTLALEEMQGGSFTITNGGVFGSLMSTPIINAPQSAILGMHKIQERPIALNGQVV
ncbi:MAG TPA: dihydrolipoyllysine-residue succinyltransferase, partial [Chitinophagales bacterium]|nr:dihydrolipoyllysine-residue succinyltransferase [Chitinophagales bacterium]